MCPYMIYFKGMPPICEPKNELCTMCVAGNQKTFNEIEEEKKEEMKNKFPNFS